MAKSLFPFTLYVNEAIEEDGYIFLMANESLDEIPEDQGKHIAIYELKEIREMVVTRELK